MFSNILSKAWSSSNTKRETDLDMKKPKNELLELSSNHAELSSNALSKGTILNQGEMYLINGSQTDILMKDVECTPKNKLFLFEGFSIKKNKYSSITIDCSSMRHLRWHAPEMLQFVMKVNDLIYLEYGIYCPSETQVTQLYKAMVDRLCLIFTIEYSSMIELHKYDDANSSFSLTEQSAKFCIYKAAQENSYFIIAISNKTGVTNNIQFLVFLSALDGMRPLEEESIIDFWIPQNAIDTISLFRCKFEDTNCVTSVVEILKNNGSTDNLLDVEDDNKSDETNPKEVADKDFVLLDESDDEMDGVKNSKTFKSKIHVDNDVKENKLLKIGKKNAFLIRKSSNLEVDMAILRLNSKGANDNKTIIRNKAFGHNGDIVEPYQANLHDKDNKLILFDQFKPNDVYMMDVEREQIIQKWTDKSLNISTILNKPSNMDDSTEPFVLGYTPQTIFSLDTRVNGKISGQRLSYATPLNFNSGAVNRTGNLLLSSSTTNELRLFNNFSDPHVNLRSAKTLFKNIGSPIHYVTVTEDGNWILGTAKKFLYLQCTIHKKSNLENGFSMNLRHNVRFDPIYLEIECSDWHLIGASPKDFVKATFDLSETSIIAIADSFAFIWNFSDVKKGILNNYKICILDQIVKDIGINAHQDGQDLIMATERGIAFEPLAIKNKQHKL